MLIISLDMNSKCPLYEQIYEFIKNEIKTGKLPVHTKLPSTRSLAMNLQISRSTVDLAYHQLLSEGYIESKPKSGYYVAMIGELINLKKTMNTIKTKAKEPKLKAIYDFSPFMVDLSSFPFSIWRKLNNQCMNDMHQDLFLLGDNQGDFELRSSIAHYLHGSRGVNCAEDQIIIGAGTDYLLQLLSQLLRDTNAIAIENPTYMRAYHIFAGMGFNICPIPVNGEGIDINMLETSGADTVYVTPSHQYPLGVVMPIKKRLELLEWASKKEERYIIEDDHDSEFRYIGKPIPSLQGIDSKQRVIYMGTFSRAIAPAIRVGYMVLPTKLLQRYKRDFFYYSSTVSRIDQAIISRFIKDGYFERHVNKLRKRYKYKHDVMIKALKIFQDKIRISGENAGLHLVVEFLFPVSEEEIIMEARRHDIQLYGLNRHFVTEQTLKYPTILLGYANLSEEVIQTGIKRLYEVLLPRII